MATYRAAIYQNIKFDKFNIAPETERFQRLLDSTSYLCYDLSLKDYNILAVDLTPAFYKLPFITMTFVNGNTLQNICQEYYEDPDYWFLVARFMKIQDVTELDITEVKLPVLTNLTQYLMMRMINAR